MSHLLLLKFGHTLTFVVLDCLPITLFLFSLGFAHLMLVVAITCLLQKILIFGLAVIAFIEHVSLLSIWGSVLWCVNDELWFRGHL